VDITAASTLPGEPSDTVTIYISKGRKIKLTAEPEDIIAYGESSSTITAAIVDVNNVIVTDEIYEIVFVILSGEGVLSGLNPQNTVGGVAEMTLISTSGPGDIITVSARAMGLTPDSVTVQTIYPKFIFLSADSSWLYEGEEVVISIDVIDSVGDSVEYTGSINLTLSGSGLGSIDTNTLSYPEEDTAYFTALSNGEVTITADGDFINSDLVTIQILEKITFADSINILDSGNTITFDISIWGEPLVIEQMQVNWDPLSLLYLSKISIDSNIVIDNATANPEDEFIDIIDTTLLSGTYTIGLYFSGDMNGKTIAVIFFDSDLGYGPLEFTVIPE